MGPRPGYWRPSAMSIYFKMCFNQRACLGMIEPAYLPDGECAKNYEGVLCATCANGF